MDTVVGVDSGALQCENCSAVSSSGLKFCSNCSFPVGGTAEEKTSFRLTVSSRTRLLKDAQQQTKSAKTTLYVMAGLVTLQGLLFGFVQDDFAAMIVSLFIAVIYLILAAWSSKNPFGATLTALIIYATLILVNAVVDPATIFQGIVLKIIFIGAFVRGIRAAQEAKRFTEELEKLKAAPVGRE